MQTEEIDFYLSQDVVALPAGTTLRLQLRPNLDMSHTIHDELTVINSDLTNLDASDATFNNCTFYQTDLRGLRVEGALFVNCTFDGVDLSSMTGDWATFDGCEFRSCCATSTYVCKSKFIRCSFAYTSVSSRDDISHFLGCTFDSTTFRSCDLRLADMDSTVFMSCTIQGSDLLGASLAGSGFYGCAIENTVLRDTWLDGSIFEDCVVDADLDEADAKRALFKGCDLADSRGEILGDADTEVIECELSEDLVFTNDEEVH
jgi:fluoroquinolone resistance protein